MAEFQFTECGMLKDVQEIDFRSSGIGRDLARHVGPAIINLIFNGEFCFRKWDGFSCSAHETIAFSPHLFHRKYSRRINQFKA